MKLSQLKIVQLRSKNKRTLKFTFSEKATKIDKIFTVNLTVCNIYFLIHSLSSPQKMTADVNSN